MNNGLGIVKAGAAFSLLPHVVGLRGGKKMLRLESGTDCFFLPFSGPSLPAYGDGAPTFRVAFLPELILWNQPQACPHVCSTKLLGATS